MLQRPEPLLAHGNRLYRICRSDFRPLPAGYHRSNSTGHNDRYHFVPTPQSIPPGAEPERWSHDLVRRALPGSHTWHALDDETPASGRMADIFSTPGDLGFRYWRLLYWHVVWTTLLGSQDQSQKNYRGFHRWLDWSHNCCIRCSLVVSPRIIRSRLPGLGRPADNRRSMG